MMYNEMTGAIADEIQIKLTPEEARVLAKTQKVDPAAYDVYLKGQFHWNKFTPDDIDKAEQYFEAALEQDPDYGLANTGIAWVWIGRRQMGLVLPSEATPKIRKAALRALELDSTLAEAHCALATNLCWGEWEWEKA